MDQKLRIEKEKEILNTVRKKLGKQRRDRKDRENVTRKKEIKIYLDCYINY